MSSQKPISKVKKPKVKKVCSKPCKECSGKRYANTSYCWIHYRAREKAKKEEKSRIKQLRKEGTKKYQKDIEKSLIKKNDKLFQQLCRKLFDRCYFGHEYCCGHHFVRKATSLYLRYSLNNIIPVCNKCHCSIHQAQKSTLEARFVMDKGDEWLIEIEKQSTKIVENKLEFLLSANKALKLSLSGYN